MRLNINETFTMKRGLKAHKVSIGVALLFL